MTLSEEIRVNMTIFVVEATTNSLLEDLTNAARDVLNQIYECKQGSSVLIMQCKHDTDCRREEPSIKAITAWEKVLRQLEMSSAVMVYHAEGDVFEHFFDLLLIADFRIIRSGSQIGFSRSIGSSLPGMSLYRLANQIGQAQARRVGMAGKTLAADEAYGLGLVDEVSDGGREALDRAIAKFSELPSSELAIRRRLLLEAHSLEYDNALGSYWAARARNRSGALA